MPIIPPLLTYCRKCQVRYEYHSLHSQKRVKKRQTVIINHLWIFLDRLNISKFEPTNRVMQTSGIIDYSQLFNFFFFL